MSQKQWLSMLALRDEMLPTGDELVEAFRQACPDLPPVRDFKKQRNVHTFGLGEAVVAFVLFPKPIPWEHLEGPCSCAWYWPTATEEMRHHQAHLLVTVVDDSSSNSVAKSILLTQVTAVLSALTQTSGIFWGPGRLVHPVPAFTELAGNMSRDYLPLYLWVDFRMEPEGENSYRLFTTGLASLGQLELEVQGFVGDPKELQELTYNIAHYLLDTNKAINDGETIGVSEDQPVTISRGPSMLDEEQQVMHLAFH